MADTIADNPAMQTMVNMYVAAYNYSKMPGGDDKALKQMQQNMQNIDVGALANDPSKDADVEASRGLEAITSGFKNEGGDVIEDYAGFVEYMESESGAQKIKNDNAALSAMMGAVKVVANDYQDLDSLSQEGLFGNSEVAEQVDSYVKTVKALAGMSDDEFNALKAALTNIESGAIVVLIAADGSVSVVPNID
jgi:hypothetical protein